MEKLAFFRRQYVFCAVLLAGCQQPVSSSSVASIGSESSSSAREEIAQNAVFVLHGESHIVANLSDGVIVVGNKNQVKNSRLAKRIEAGVSADLTENASKLLQEASKLKDFVQGLRKVLSKIDRNFGASADKSPVDYVLQQLTAPRSALGVAALPPWGPDHPGFLMREFLDKMAGLPVEATKDSILTRNSRANSCSTVRVNPMSDDEYRVSTIGDRYYKWGFKNPGGPELFANLFITADPDLSCGTYAQVANFLSVSSFSVEFSFKSLGTREIKGEKRDNIKTTRVARVDQFPDKKLTVSGHWGDSHYSNDGPGFEESFDNAYIQMDQESEEITFQPSGQKLSVVLEQEFNK